MPKVWVPSNLQRLTGQQKIVEVGGRTVAEVVDNLERMFPGVKQGLVQGDDLIPGMSVFVNGEQSLMGLLEYVEDEAELHFLPAIGGGEFPFSFGNRIGAAGEVTGQPLDTSHDGTGL